MKDIICREDAIELLERQKEKDSKGYAGNFCRTIVDRCVKAIENMPSAERTGTCKTCKYRHVGSGFCPMVHMSMDGELYELNEDNDSCSRYECVSVWSRKGF